MGNKVFSCQLCKTKNAWPTYVYSICKTGPLPQALWMSDRSLFAAKVPCVYFFLVHVCVYNLPFFLIKQSGIKSPLFYVSEEVLLIGLNSKTYAKEGKISGEPRFGGAGSVPHPSTSATIVTHLSPHLYPTPNPFSTLHPEWSNSGSLVLCQPCCPNLPC